MVKCTIGQIQRLKTALRESKMTQPLIAAAMERVAEHGEPAL